MIVHKRVVNTTASEFIAPHKNHQHRYQQQQQQNLLYVHVKQSLSTKRGRGQEESRAEEVKRFVKGLTR